jgi:hypothetical protein
MAYRGRFGVVCILHFALCMTTIQPASAMVLLPTDFTTVVAEASAIVYGRVGAVRSGLTGPQRTIESFVALQVIESLKGSSSPGETVTFRVPSGQVGRYRKIVIGAPEFAEGDEVVVFLRGSAPAIPTLYGSSQGVYRVARNGGTRAVVMPAPVAAQGAGPERVVRGDSARKPVPVETFAREVRAIAEGRR